jgi:hypothetical protein
MGSQFNQFHTLISHSLHKSANGTYGESVQPVPHPHITFPSQVNHWYLWGVSSTSSKPSYHIPFTSQPMVHMGSQFKQFHTLIFHSLHKSASGTYGESVQPVPHSHITFPLQVSHWYLWGVSSTSYTPSYHIPFTNHPMVTMGNQFNQFHTLILHSLHKSANGESVQPVPHPHITFPSQVSQWYLWGVSSTSSTPSNHIPFTSQPMEPMVSQFKQFHTLISHSLHKSANGTYGESVQTVPHPHITFPLQVNHCYLWGVSSTSSKPSYHIPFTSQPMEPMVSQFKQFHTLISHSLYKSTIVTYGESVQLVPHPHITLPSQVSQWNLW